MGVVIGGRVERGLPGGITNIKCLLKSHMDTYRCTTALLVYALKPKLTPFQDTGNFLFPGKTQQKPPSHLW